MRNGGQGKSGWFCLPVREKPGNSQGILIHAVGMNPVRYLYLYLFIYLFTYLFIYSSFQLFIHAFIYTKIAVYMQVCEQAECQFTRRVSSA